MPEQQARATHSVLEGLAVSFISDVALKITENVETVIVGKHSVVEQAVLGQ